MSAETITSSGMPLLRTWRLVVGTALVNGLVSMPLTTAADGGFVQPQGRTEAAFPNQLLVPHFHEVEAHSASEAILEARRLSGLTWQELADMLGVHRRSLHLWANGQPINAANEHRLLRLLGVLRRLDRGEAKRNRSLLLEPQPNGVSVFDLLSGERFDDAVALVGVGQGRQQRPTTPLASDAAEARRPLPVGQLLGALQDRVHESNGRLVRSKADHLRADTKV